ncbi:HlyD family type I secretion periplasmic adaptor subunit [Erwinia aphidicola]|uniref:HlyD family type I secretion periplasmic adaptor subunit n=1 Tax=uncultured Erwinia sp. TaxID=246798 RepID=UPI0017476BCA|nr:HlyD family type I secretion periplasmic adaptor subunit [Erwinia aphidicola]MBD1377066.1 HlyD family type I secretion periplasmic adaptor subunit [Erwinia aphidicola]MBD1377606.1 HlyD family type I secretion periplasmic adaptor subunit [Erwinia aphidicola]
MNGQKQYHRPLAEKSLPRSTVLVWSLALMLLSFVLWANFYTLDEVTTGTGKVIPSSHEQIVQSLEGGIVHSINVQEGEVVERGQRLAQLDRTKTESGVQESLSRLHAALATAARLTAQINDTPLVFPPELNNEPDLVKSETELYNSSRNSLEKQLSGLKQGVALIRRELAMTKPLVKQGAASDVEVLRLQRQINEMESKATDLETQYHVRAGEELAKANAEIETQRSVILGRKDSLNRLDFFSPVKGIVKNIEVNTVGGVIPPNGMLMTLVPIDDQMLVEAQISPRDVAFIHPGQKAKVKITAYDYSIYGSLDGEVTTISPDTIQDDVRRDVYYYRVKIKTNANYLENKHHEKFYIFPGMIATVDIKTGNKSILDYLLKPLNKMNEALRER